MTDIQTSTGKTISSYQLEALKEGWRKKNRNSEFHILTTDMDAQLIREGANAIGLSLTDFIGQSATGSAQYVLDSIKKQGVELEGSAEG